MSRRFDDTSLSLKRDSSVQVIISYMDQSALMSSSTIMDNVIVLTEAESSSEQLFCENPVVVNCESQQQTETCPEGSESGSDPMFAVSIFDFIEACTFPAFLCLINAYFLIPVAIRWIRRRVSRESQMSTWYGYLCLKLTPIWTLDGNFKIWYYCRGSCIFLFFCAVSYNSFRSTASNSASTRAPSMQIRQPADEYWLTLFCYFQSTQPNDSASVFQIDIVCHTLIDGSNFVRNRARMSVDSRNYVIVAMRLYALLLDRTFTFLRNRIRTLAVQ